MKLLLVCVLALLASVRAHGHGDHGHSHGGHDDHHDHGTAAVSPLTSQSFASSIQESPVTLVEFFAPWCGHCKALAPNYEAAAKRLKADESPAALASVDCTVEKDLCSQYGVKGFPTLKLFRASTDNPTDYQGGRTADDIYAFMSKQSQPAYVELKSADDAADFFARPGVKVVGAFEDLTSDDAAAYLETANSMRQDFSFAVTDSASLLSAHGGASAPSVSVFKDGEAPIAHASGFSGATIAKFINTEAFPVLGDIGPENFQKYVDRGLPMAWVFYDPQAADLQAQLHEVTEAAKKVKGELSVVKLDGVKWAEHAKHFGLDPKLLPGVVVEDRAANKMFLFPQTSEFTSSALAAHFQGFVDKTLQPNVKTQEPPAENDGAVRVVVGKTFDEEVLNNDRDVFVEFYAPWCGHCKALAPKWEELGGLFADNDRVVIAKVDATENDTPAKVQGFPTLILYPAGKKDTPIPYEGDRTPSAMADFIRSNGGSFAAGHDEL